MATKKRIWILRATLLSLSTAVVLGRSPAGHAQRVADAVQGTAQGTTQARDRDLYQEGIRLYNAKQDRAALASFNQAIAHNPNHAEAYVGRGNTWRALREYRSALQDFNRAIQLKPDYEDAYIYRGKTYWAVQQGDQAIADFTQASAVNPRSGKGHFERANAYQAFYPNRPATALTDLNEAIRREPNNPQYYNRRGGLLSETNNFAQAIADYDRAIALQPTLAAAYGNRGLAHYWLNRQDDAAKDFQQCLVLDPALRPWLEQQIQLIPAVQQQQAEFLQWYNAILREASKSRADSCSGKYGQTGARVANCRSHGEADTQRKIDTGEF